MTLLKTFFYMGNGKNEQNKQEKSQEPKIAQGGQQSGKGFSINAISACFGQRKYFCEQY